MMRQKTILYLRTDLGCQNLVAGGSVSHTMGVIKGFKELGYQVIAASSAVPKIIKKEVGKFVRLKNWAIFSFFGFKLNCVLSNLFFTLQSLKGIKNKEITFVYQRYSMLNVSGVLIRYFKKVPLILEFNSSAIWTDKNWTPQKRLRLYWLVVFFEKLNLKYSDYIIAVSQAIKDNLVAQGVEANKILVNPNGVDTNAFNPEKLKKERELIRTSLGITDKFIFGFIGTFSPWHGIELLAKMIPQVIEKKPQSHFLLIGNGPLFAYLKKEIERTGVSKSVTFLGMVSHQKAKEYLAACDAFLSPTQPNADGSRFFGSPTKIFEYLSLAKPIIASDLEQLSEIINPAIKYGERKSIKDECGLLVNPQNVERFVTSACMVIDLDDEKRKKIGLNGRNKAIKQYTWKMHIKKIIDLIK